MPSPHAAASSAANAEVSSSNPPTLGQELSPFLRWATDAEAGSAVGAVVEGTVVVPAGGDQAADPFVESGGRAGNEGQEPGAHFPSVTACL